MMMQRRHPNGNFQVSKSSALLEFILVDRTASVEPIVKSCPRITKALLNRAKRHRPEGNPKNRLKSSFTECTQIPGITIKRKRVGPGSRPSQKRRVDLSEPQLRDQSFAARCVLMRRCRTRIQSSITRK